MSDLSKSGPDSANAGIPPDIYNAVEPAFKAYNVPDPIWETVVEVESAWNPRAVGDNGSSFGLFQLHRGGQLGNLTPEQAYDPATNARVAAPAIASAYNEVRGFDPHTRYYWLKFAEKSGHPGGNDNDVATQNEAERLYATYTNGTYGSANTSIPASNGSIIGSAGDWINTQVGNYIHDNFVAPLTGGAVKVGIFILAIVLVIAGMWAISRGDQ